MEVAARQQVIFGNPSIGTLHRQNHGHEKDASLHRVGELLNVEDRQNLNTRTSPK